jgi:hypothetical protein
MQGLTGKSVACARWRAIDLGGELGVVEFGDGDVRKAKLGGNVLLDEGSWDRVPAVVRDVGGDGDSQ